MKYISLLIIFFSITLIGCTSYTSSYYDVSAAQWQHMPMQQQNISIYAYNTQQAMQREQQSKATFNPF